ncbi:MAG: PilZ domain-containing protein [Kofleriaceae bacterium]|nr:PilZ domain-containing protein [Kofleriaceae bacterium]
MDKREAVRVPVRVRARCRCHGLVIEGFVEDLSRSGMFLRSEHAIGAGSPAEIDLEVPGELPLRLEAEVVRIERGSRREGMAFRFIDQLATKRTLANFIMRQHQSAQ